VLKIEVEDRTTDEYTKTLYIYVYLSTYIRIFLFVNIFVLSYIQDVEEVEGVLKIEVEDRTTDEYTYQIIHNI
jgi:hypothetical protein